MCKIDSFAQRWSDRPIAETAQHRNKAVALCTPIIPFSPMLNDVIGD